MEERKDSSMSLSDEQLDNIVGGRGPGNMCHVRSEFPHYGLCYLEILGSSVRSFIRNCSYCSMIPGEENNVYLFECGLYGYSIPKSL